MASPPPRNSSLTLLVEPEAINEAELHEHPAVRPLAEKLTRHSSKQGSVHFEYLTFETTLPDFSDLSSGPLAPQPPKLKQYQSPFEWSVTLKNICVILSCAATFVAAYSAGSYSIAVGPLTEKFNISTETFQTGVTTWAMGFACSPMFLAPLSEISGRRPIFLLSGFVFLVAQIGCAVTDSFAGMLVARFFVGAGASTFATMVGGVMSDVFHAEHRNTPMALYSACALAGTGFGPMLSGFIIGRATWRWVFWHQVLSLGTVMFFMVIFFKETRGSVLLSRKASKINKYYDELDAYHSEHPESVFSVPRVRYRVAADEARASVGRLLYFSLTTPFKLLVTEPVVFFFSLWAAFAWGVLYLQLNVLPLVYSTNHNFNTEQCGAVFAALIVGTAIGLALSLYSEKLAKRWWPHIASTPEGRLYFTCLEAAFLPIGLFWFGWTSYSSIHWIVPTIAIGFAQIGIFSIYLAVFNYLADVYHRLASSALACQSFCRNTLAAVFPLFSEIMFRNLGFPGASSLLGGISAVLTIVPWILVWNGPKIRARSKVASEIMVKHSS